jgi:hypothetical protein
MHKCLSFNRRKKIEIFFLSKENSGLSGPSGPDISKKGDLTNDY